MKWMTGAVIAMSAGWWTASAWGIEGVEMVRRADGGVEVRAAVYAARVDTNGALESLVIEGVEFLARPLELTYKEQPRRTGSVFACPLGQWFNPYDPAPVKEVVGNTVQCAGNGWKLDYTFLPEAIDLTWDGVPTGALGVRDRGFSAPYPGTLLAINFAPDLHRACDPGNQGELGWPATRNHEPGTFAVLATNGAGVIAADATGFYAGTHGGFIPKPPHRFDVLYYRLESRPGPHQRRLRLFRKADLAQAVTMAIHSPNRQHLFPATNEVVFPVTVRTLYGQALRGQVRFDGAPYVWKEPQLTGSVPIEVAANSETTVRLPIRPPKPGHYTGLIQVTDGDQPIYSQRVGFMYRPEAIPPAVAPADFDEFWDQTLAELDKIPLDLTLEEQTDKETSAGQVFKAKFRSWGGRWAWAWLYVPKREGKLPGKVRCPAVSYWQPGQALAGVDELRIDAAVHGGDLKDFPAQPDFDYMSTGITNRETYAMRYGICCLVRCFDIIQKHAKCNGEVSIEGGSQGAGLAMTLAGLRHATRVQGVAVAWCRVDWTVLGHAQWGPRAPEGSDPKQIAEIVRYYDAASFAHRIHAPLKYAIGLFDFCAPAEGIFSAFNALPKDTPCQVFIDPYGGHFTLDLADFNQGEGIVEVPRWYGTDADNKLNR